MRKKEKLGKRIIHSLDIDEFALPRDTLEMRGTNELTVREVGRFLHYSESEIRLSLREYILKISGENLYCSTFLAGVVRVNGEIKNLEIEKRERGYKNEQTAKQKG